MNKKLKQIKKLNRAINTLRDYCKTVPYMKCVHKECVLSDFCSRELGDNISPYGWGNINEKEALKRNKNKFKPFVCGNCAHPHSIETFSGHIGEKIEWKDELGKTLRVGDTVKVRWKYEDKYTITTLYKINVDTYGVVGFANHGFCERKDLVIVKLPRQKCTKWCTLIETYKEMKKHKRYKEAHKC